MCGGDNLETFNNCMLIAETEKAWRVDMGEGTVEWFPKSQCEFDVTVSRLGRVYGTLSVPEWLVRRKGL